MPLIIDYRPVKLPPEALAPRRVAAPVVAVPKVEAVVAPRHTPNPSRKREGLFKRWAGIAGVAAIGFALWLAGPGWMAPGVPTAQARDGLQPFERPGDSFPGSAFYYLASDDTGLLTPDAAKAAWDAQLAQIHGDDAQGATGPITGSGPAARPITMRGTSVDQSRALECLTAAIYYEAASEPDAGQRAVAQVVLNRVAHPAWPKTVCGVVYQGSERPGCQFSFACDGSMARRPVAAFWDRARRVAADALAGYVYAPVGLATHYHTSAVHPYWADSLTFIGTIGAHRFYRWSGAAGRPQAFGAVYAGGEPMAAPHPRTWTPAAADVADPIQLEKAFEAGRIEALKSAQAAPQPAGRNAAAFGQQPLTDYTQPRQAGPQFAPAVEARGGDALYKAGQLPGGAAVNPAYENAGKWIAQPGG